MLLDEGIVFDHVRDLLRAATATEEAAALVASKPALATPVVTARLVMSQARGLWRGDKPVEAVEAFKRAIEVGEPLGDEAYEAYTTSMSLGSSAAAALGQFALSESWSDRILRVCEEHGDIVGVCYALINRSTLSFLTDQIDRLLVDLERAVQISREFGMPLAESMCVRDLGKSICRSASRWKGSRTSGGLTPCTPRRSARWRRARSTARCSWRVSSGGAAMSPPPRRSFAR